MKKLNINNLNLDVEQVTDSSGESVLTEKLTDAMLPGAVVEFDPEEAEQIGAFAEDALDEVDALESSIDLTDMG